MLPTLPFSDTGPFCALRSMRPCTSRTPSGPMIEAGFSLYQSSRLSRYDAMS